MNSPNKHIKILFTALLIALAPMPSLYSTPADVRDISNTKYFPAVLEAIKNAKQSIYIVMYLINIIPGETETPQYKLLQELINARKRSVKVTVIMDYRKSGKYEEGQTGYKAYKILKESGIDVRFDTPDIYTHNKTIIIDAETVITGSANWSTAALTQNNETNLLIRSPALAKEILSGLETIRLLTPYPYEQNNIRIPYTYLLNTGPAQEMLNHNDHRSFDIYLTLLKLQEEKISPTYETISQNMGYEIKINPVTYRRLIKYIRDKPHSINNLNDGVAKSLPRSILLREELIALSSPPRRNVGTGYSRAVINRALYTLAKKYKLIKFKPRFNRPFALEITGIDKSQQSFPLPYAYWTYYWHKRLELSQKILLLIILAELGQKPVGIEQKIGRKEISRKYGISGWSASIGLTGLKNWNVVEIQYGEIDKGYEHRAPNTIKYLGLYDWNKKEEEIKQMEKIYGAKKTKKAITYAKIIYKQNDPVKIKEILSLLDKYGEQKVNKAFLIIPDFALAKSARRVKCLNPKGFMHLR